MLHIEKQTGTWSEQTSGQSRPEREDAGRLGGCSECWGQKTGGVQAVRGHVKQDLPGVQVGRLCMLRECIMFLEKLDAK